MTARCVSQLTAVLFLLAVSFHLPARIAGADSGALSPKPNIVLIITDDMRFDQLQYMPNTMSKLATKGVRFEQGLVASPLCGPNRVSLLGGQYVHTHQIDCNDAAARNFKHHEHLGIWLQQHGYVTAMIGKWLNGTEPKQITPWPYVADGFDDWRALIGQDTYRGASLIENGRIVSYTTEDYSTVVLGRHARTFIASVPLDRPFFLLFAPNAPHSPYTPETPADLRIGQSIPFPSTPAFNEANVADKPAYVRARVPLTLDEQAQIRSRWSRQNATLQSLDRQIAAILDDLAAAGRLARTDIYFTSDNGLMMGEHRLTGGKSCVYEECIRVPFVVRMAHVTPRVDTTHLVSTLDLTATILARAGAAAPYDIPGRNLVPLLRDAATPWRDDVLVEFLSSTGERPPFQAVRTSADLYAEYRRGEREYYNLSADPFQLINRVNDPLMKTRVQALTTRLAQLRAQ
jgi:N-acetylglucosamine-6-sulfatase